MTDNNFDFGFTTVDEDELEAVRNASQKVEQLCGVESKLSELYNAITPLLKQLKLNPEKDYIYWPNRVEKIEKFEQYIASIKDE